MGRVNRRGFFGFLGKGAAAATAAAVVLPEVSAFPRFRVPDNTPIRVNESGSITYGPW